MKKYTIKEIMKLYSKWALENNPETFYDWLEKQEPKEKLPIKKYLTTEDVSGICGEEFYEKPDELITDVLKKKLAEIRIYVKRLTDGQDRILDLLEEIYQKVRK